MTQLKLRTPFNEFFNVVHCYGFRGMWPEFIPNNIHNFIENRLWESGLRVIYD